MENLGNFFSNFIRIDLDTQGGYARVAEVLAKEGNNYPELCAFKVMRHEIEYSEGIKRFTDELELLSSIAMDNSAPAAITKIYESGYVPCQLSEALSKHEIIKSNTEIIRTGLDPQNFLDKGIELEKDGENLWLPFLVVELAAYDDSLLRQIHNQPKDDHEGLFRFPNGEVIIMALQLLEAMNYLHEKHNRAYMDWKPEHIHWNSTDMQVKLIDWNITTELDSHPGRNQNIKDDLRLFCGAVLYISLTFIDPDEPMKPIGPRPTRELETPIPELRRRYLTNEPNFYQREITLDNNLKEIIRKGLHPLKGFESIAEFKSALIEYAKHELGLTEEEITLKHQPLSPYFRAIIEVNSAQQKLLQAQRSIYEAVKTKGNNPEFMRLFNSIKYALKNFPTSGNSEPYGD